MKIVVLVKDVSVQQWMGRLLNEAGWCPERIADLDIEFVNTVEEAVESARQYSSDQVVSLVCSSAVRGIDLLRIGDFPGERVVIAELDCRDRYFMDHTLGETIAEEDLTASRLNEILNLVHV